MRIGIDIDEVLSETLDCALAYNNYSIEGLPIRREDFSEYSIWLLPKYQHIPKESCVSFFTNAILDARDTDKLAPLAGAREALEKGKKNWHHFVAITARGSLVKETTLAWISQFFPGIFDEVVFCNYHNPDEPQFTKEEICHKIGVTMMVEDNLHYARDLANARIPVYLLARPRNTSYNTETDHKIKKVKDWSEIDFEMIPE